MKTPQLTESPCTGRHEGPEGIVSPEYEQIEMFSQEEMQGVAQVPWGGRRPRELTRAFRRFSFAATPPWGLRE